MARRTCDGRSVPLNTNILGGLAQSQCRRGRGPRGTQAGLPWFDYYGGDAKALEGGEALDTLKSVSEMGKQKGESPLPENVTVDVGVLSQCAERIRRRCGRWSSRGARKSVPKGPLFAPLRPLHPQQRTFRVVPPNDRL